MSKTLDLLLETKVCFSILSVYTLHGYVTGVRKYEFILRERSTLLAYCSYQQSVYEVQCVFCFLFIYVCFHIFVFDSQGCHCSCYLSYEFSSNRLIIIQLGIVSHQHLGSSSRFVSAKSTLLCCCVCSL